MKDLIAVCSCEVFPLGEGDFSEDVRLHSHIEHYCQKEGFDPIYIDRNVAIFKDRWLGAYWTDDLQKVS